MSINLDSNNQHISIFFGFFSTTTSQLSTYLTAAEAAALGRAAGWVAYAMEQIEDGRLIRPRARYIGPDESAP